MRFRYGVLLIWSLFLFCTTELYSSEDQNIFDDNEELFGRELIERYFPPLIESVESIAPYLANSFFAGWTESDLLLFLATIEATGNKSNKVLKGSISSDISGVLTNIFGNIELRRRYLSNEGYVFVSELVLDRVIKYLNKAVCLEELSQYCDINDVKTSRHDGIVYRWEDGKFVIYEVLESKVDGKYKVKQGEGVLDRWKHVGIFLGGYHILSDLIYLKDKKTGELVPITSVSESYFKTYTFLSLSKGFSLRASEKRGEKFLVPFSNVFVNNGNKFIGNPGFFYVLADKLVDILPRYYSMLKGQVSHIKGKHISSAVISGFLSLYVKYLSKKSEYVVQYRRDDNNNIFYSVYDETLFLYTFVIPFYVKIPVKFYLKKLLPYELIEPLIYLESCEDFFSIDF